MAFSSRPALTFPRICALVLVSLALITGLPCLSSAAAPEKTLMLATTTSVDATGLLNLLADEFKKESGITLRWIAVGTGAALGFRLICVGWTAERRAECVNLC